MTVDRFNTLYPDKSGATPAAAAHAPQDDSPPGIQIPKPFFTAGAADLPTPTLRVVAWVLLGVGIALYVLGHLAIFLKAFQESTFWFVFMFIMQIVVTSLSLVNNSLIYLIFMPISALPFIAFKWHMTPGGRWMFFPGLLLVGIGAWLYVRSPESEPIPWPENFKVPSSIHLPENLKIPGSSRISSLTAPQKAVDPLAQRLEASFEQVPAGEQQ